MPHSFCMATKLIESCVQGEYLQLLRVHLMKKPHYSLSCYDLRLNFDEHLYIMNAPIMIDRHKLWLLVGTTPVNWRLSKPTTFLLMPQEETDFVRAMQVWNPHERHKWSRL